MELSATEIGIALAALRPILLPGLLQRAVEPGPRQLALALYAGGRQHWLFFSLASDDLRLHLVDRNPPAPQQLPRFCALLRARLVGARLLALEQAEGDRSVLLRFGRGAEQLELELRLRGRPGDAALRTAAGEVLGTWSGRPLPPPKPGGDPQRAQGSRFGAGLAGLEALRAAAEREAAQRSLELRRAALLRAARQRLGQASRRVAGVAGDLARVERSEQLRREGELLRDNFHLLRRGQRSIRVVDYGQSDLPEIELTLDPSLSPSEAVARCFARYRALQAARARIEQRLGQARTEEQRAVALVERLRTAPSAEALNGVAAAAGLARPASATGAAREKPAKRGSELPKGIRALVHPSGARILVGKGAAENDALTFRVARGRDVWLHLRDWPGPHVVLQWTGSSQEPPPQALLDAALLALHFSRRGRAEGVAEVTWTQAKNLRRAGRPGEVFVAGGRSLRIEHDPQRVARLLGAEGSP